MYQIGSTQSMIYIVTHAQTRHIYFIDPKQGIKYVQVSALILNGGVVSQGLRLVLTLLLLRCHGLYTSAMMLDK